LIDMRPSNLQRERAAISPPSHALSARGEAKPLSATGSLDALFLMNSLNVGGSERKITRLANELTLRNLRVGIAALNGPDTLAPTLDPAVQLWRLQRRGKFSLRAMRSLIEIVKQRQPRVLFCVNMYPTLYAVAISIAMGQRAPRIIGLINTTDFGPQQRWRQRFYSRFLRRLDWLVYGCELQRDAWTSRSHRLGERAQIIYNGVDTQEFRSDALNEDRDTLRYRAGYSTNTFVVGSVGRLAAAKNQRILIDSVAQLRSEGIDARLIIAGDGPLRANLEQHAASRGLSTAVHFTGALQDVRPVIAMLDVFVLPSLFIETFSNAALEAMAMNTPVILSRVGGAAEMIQDGDEGFLVEPSELSERLPKLLQQLANDGARKNEMAVRARRRVERDFALHTMVEQYASLIRRFAV
jgi:glycosyltransferase involved in cell wall biosynthesis